MGVNKAVTETKRDTMYSTIQEINETLTKCEDTLKYIAGNIDPAIVEKSFLNAFEMEVSMVQDLKHIKGQVDTIYNLLIATRNTLF